MALTLLIAACGQDPQTGNGSGLPPDGSSGSTSGSTGGTGNGNAGTSWTGSGSGLGPAAGDDETPAHSLSLVQEGSWTLSPPAGPTESLTGSLTVTEILDGDDSVPACTATFALTGTVRDASTDGSTDGTSTACPDCSVTFSVLHVLSQDGDSVEGTDGQSITVPGLDGCLAPDLPADDDSWVLGLADDTSGLVIRRRLGLSGWQTWYDAEQIGATVSFWWTGEVSTETDGTGDTGSTL